MAAFLAMILKEQKPNFAFLLVLFVSTMIFIFLVDHIKAIIHMINKIAANTKVNMVYMETILKIIGIAYITEFASHLTKDAGESALAAKLEFAGKIVILAMAIPILTVLIETILNMIPNG